jgi:spermidine synthase
MAEPARSPQISVFYVNVLVVAACGLVYELLAATLASYLLGDSITQFSLIIGLFISALGAGAFVSRWVDRGLARTFIEVELGVALLGGLSAPLLFFAFAHSSAFYVVLYALVFLIGALVGLELPLLMRILREHLSFKDLVSRVLTFDYLGALLASILFPLVFVPRLGLVRTSLAIGVLNGLVALWGTYTMRGLLGGSVVGLRARAVLVVAGLTVGIAFADGLTTLAEAQMFPDEVVYARQSRYQRIVVTRGKAGFQLYLNGNLQFSSVDERRYHEALVHPALLARGGAVRVLVLGGGDGLALREILRWPVAEVTLVDLDRDMINLSERFPPLGELNRHAFDDPRVTVAYEDAMIWLEEGSDRWDAAIVDFPDPNNFALGKLYTTRFYRLLARRLAPGATVAVQSTSPLFARESFWCIVRTLEAAGFKVAPYQTTVPSFGVWGFALARIAPLAPPTSAAAAPAGLTYLNDDALAAMFRFSADMTPVPVEVNRLDNQVLVRTYEREWRRWD